MTRKGIGWCWMVFAIILMVVDIATKQDMTTQFWGAVIISQIWWTSMHRW